MGIPTIYVGSARDVMDQVKPPRSAFVDFPFGRQCGRPFDREGQMNIIKDALNALKSITEPGTIIDLPYEWGEYFDCDSGAFWVGIDNTTFPQRPWLPKETLLLRHEGEPNVQEGEC